MADIMLRLCLHFSTALFVCSMSVHLLEYRWILKSISLRPSVYDLPLHTLPPGVLGAKKVKKCLICDLCD